MARVLNPGPTENVAEQDMLRHLVTLSDDYWILRELRLNVDWQGTQANERQPDFLVIGPTIGAVSIETKDWNTEHNTFEFVDQYWVRKLPSGERIKNPWHQAKQYRDALIPYTRKHGIWLTSIVAFPRLNGAAFRNSISDLRRLTSDAQAQIVIDLRHTLFGDRLHSALGGVLSALVEIVQKDPRGLTPVAGGKASLEQLVEDLIPGKFRIGDAQEFREESKKKLKVLSNRQQQRAFELPEGDHLFLDLAGSGKTNVLTSRALHLAEKSRNQRHPYSVLIVTYNAKLARSIRLMIDDKLRGDPRPREIDVMSLEELLGHLVQWAYGALEPVSTQAIVDVNRPIEERIEELWTWLEALKPEDWEEFRRYDAVMIDEVQDMGSIANQLNALLNRGAEFFSVGDVAQRIYAAHLDLAKLGIGSKHQQVTADFVMYRCPLGIARFAHRFSVADPTMKQEMQSFGYQSPQFRGYMDAYPEFEHALTDDDERHRILRIINQEHSAHLPPKDLLIVTTTDQVQIVCAWLQESGIPATDHPGASNAVLVVDYASSKGLEAEVVIVAGIERLPLQAQGGPFANKVDNLKVESMSRRMIYVALTRTRRRLLIVYEDRSNRLVDALIQADTLSQRGT